MLRIKAIAVDTSDFSFIRQGDYVYIDKTRYIYEIISKHRFYFLSRPRRFGKSLTVSTLKALFEGKKELFEGLYIHKTHWSWEEYPIIYLDFNSIESYSRQVLIEKLEEKLKVIASQYQVDLVMSTVPAMFAELVVKLYNKCQKGVVILVDEYDKPIISHLGLGNKRMETARKNQEFMKIFYDNLKAREVEDAIKTVFITGVSKFSKVSIFSALNNLIELDEHPTFATMLGYTEGEFLHYFKHHLDYFANKHNQTLEKICDDFRFAYNGFRFSSEETLLYNPYSIGCSLTYGRLDNYWFESGTPSFLIHLIQENRYDVTNLERVRVDSSDIKTYVIDKLNIESLLLQTGYLTIKEIQGNNILVLGFPNNEVKIGFNKDLLKNFTREKIELPILFDLKKALLEEEYQRFFELIQSIFASIPYSILPTAARLEQKELYYHTIFYLVTSLVADKDLSIFPEILTNKGRIDMVIETDLKVYIMEFKCNQKTHEAIEQIKEKGYAEKYMGLGKERVLIGVEFDIDLRNVKEWKMITIQ